MQRKRAGKFSGSGERMAHRRSASARSIYLFAGVVVRD
jgi:hypothetical protein